MRGLRWTIGTVVGALGVTLALNWRGLGDGLAYLDDLAHYRPAPAVPVAPRGRYAALYDLVPLDNAGREEYLEQWLGQRGLTPQRLPIPNSRQGNFLLRLGSDGPVTMFVAHWDKVSERPTYQGASDNTSGLVVLLAAALTLARQPLTRPLAFLWTGEEERGSLGAHAFVAWARETGFAVREVYNFDMLGRGALVARPVSARPGFVFTLPLRGLMVYDGRTLRPTAPHAPVDEAVVRRLRAAQPDLRIARMMTALGDTNVFNAAGWPGAMLSAANLHYLNLIWHNDADRVDLLDERNLDLAYHLILTLAASD
ncbi:MAG: M20/M25/M40 family metallo-hydrolase [Anaerolineae bacterium]|nr:M20/M25/M40 family metallo-hydrolase [Anaerolineae bacterium]